VSAIRLRKVTLAIMLLVGACTTTPPAPVIERPGSAPSVGRAVTHEPAPPKNDAAAPDVVAGTASVRERHPAVIDLLSAARDAVAAGRYDSAGAKIDQAIRIDPADPWVWHELARLRFGRGEFAQAIATARRSNALRGAPAQLMFGNLKLIAEAERLRGDTAASQQALRDARRYEPGGVTADRISSRVRPLSE
jgi:predicted Zn-dependent protease